MIIVDSSVWIDYFTGVDNPQTTHLDGLLGIELIGIGDIILTEVLQGFRGDDDYNAAKNRMLNLAVFEMLGQGNAIASAENYRALRKQGITIRKTIDCIIATFCIQNNHALLFSDRDFLPFLGYLGLKTAM
jgi:predicted nucleic acid-binding protein